MKVTVDIDESKFSFFMELLKSLNFVKVDFDMEEGLTEAHKTILLERLENSKKNPEQLVPLEEFLKKTDNSL